MNKISLKEVVNYTTQKISSTELKIDSYISTDNILQNKQGITSSLQLPVISGNIPKYNAGNILVSNIRPYLKKIYYAKKSGGVSNDVLTFQVKETFDSKFVYYSLFQDSFFEHMMSGSKGTKMPRGDKRQILDYKISKFDLLTQQKIASALSALDDKIELNNRINAELEAMAKTLYDYWFVQFDFPNAEGKPYKASDGKMVYNETLKREIPEGWEVTVFNDWINDTKAGDWGKEAIEGNYTERVYCIRGADINGINGKGEVKAPERFILKNNSSKKLIPNDFVVEISGGSPVQSTGRIALITESTLERFDTDIICSNFCKAVSIKDEKYIYNFKQEWQRLYDAGVFFGFEGKTSGIKNFLFDSFMNSYSIVLPKKEIVEKYYEFAQSIDKKIQSNLKQNQELSALRDWLLPMLMNGQVKVG